MGKALAILVLAGCAAAVAAAPAGPAASRLGAQPPAAHASGAPVRDGVPAPDGRLVLAVLSPERAMVADPRSGRTRDRRLPGGTLCHGPVLGIGDRVVFGGTRGSTPVALSLPLSLRGVARSLGPADTFAGAGERVLLARWTRLRTDSGALAVRSARPDGDAGPAAGTTLLRWSSLEGVVAGALLISHDRRLSLWHPGEGWRRAIGRGWAIATDRRRVAWCPRGCRRLRVWSQDRAVAIDPPRGTRIEEGPDAAFSPDGRLALPLRTARGVRVAVVDPATGRWRVLVHARLGSYRALAWSPSGRWLYFAGRGERLFGRRTGADRAIRLPIRTDGAVMSIATVR